MSVFADTHEALEEVHRSGEQITEAHPGAVYCVSCGFAISTASVGALPTCPNCRGDSFRRGSIFDSRPTVDVESLPSDGTAPNWLAEVRAGLEAGRYLAFEGSADQPEVVRVKPGWTRIGRSAAADLRLDHATVSRRHALIVLTESGELRALDDRSLNGLFINGRRVEWASLDDGDELEIGCFRLYVLEA